METKKCDQVHVRRTRGTNNDNYYNVEPKIPDMLTIYEEEMDDLKTNATSMLSITGLCQNNVYILNAKNESMNSQCSTRNKKFLFEKFTQIPTIPYPRCSLSGNDCIKKSILYTDKKPKFDKLPVIYSAPSSDVEGCHADDESNCCSENEKTYSVCESDDTYTVSDDERSKKLLDRYPDSFDSDSSYCLGASDEDSSNDSKSHSSVDKEVVDVVEKVINNYHNLLRNFYDPVKRKSSDRNSNRNPNDFGKPEDSLTEIILEPPDMFSDPPIVSSSETTHQGMPNTVDTQEKVSSSNSISDRLEDEQEFNLEDLSSDNIFKSETAIQCAIKSLRESEDFDCKDGFSDESTIEADDLESFYSESDPLNSTLTDDLYRFAGDSDISSEFKIPRVYVSLSDDFNVNRRDSDQQDSVDGILDSFPNRPDDGILFIDADEDANQICNPDTTFYTDSKLHQLTDPLSGEKTSIRTYLSDKSIHSSDPTLSPSQSAKNQFHSSDYAISSPYSNTNTDDTNGTFDSVESIQSNIQGDIIDSLLFNSWQPVFASEKNNSTGSSADDHEIDSYTESCKSSTCEVDDDLIGGEEDALDSKEKKNFSYDRSRTFDVESYAESVIYEDKNSKNNTPVGSINEEFAESKEHEFKIDFSVIPKTEKCQQFLYDDLRNNLPVGLKIENDANDSQPSFQNNLSTVPKIEECVRNLEQNFENNFSVVPKIEESAEYSRKELENDLSVVPKVEKYANTEQNFQNNIPVVSKLENDANNLHQSFQNNLSMVLKIEQCLRNSIQSDENDFSLVPKIEESAEYSDNELKNDLSMVPETEYYAEKSVQNFQNNLSMIPKIEECIENLEHNFKNDFSLVPKIEECIENLEHKFKNNFSLVPKIEECIENLEHNFKNNFPSFPKDEDYSENTPYNFENNSSMVPKIEKCSQNWACNFVEIPSAFPAQEKLLDSGNDSSVVCGKENSDENNFEKISSKMAEKLDPLNDSISENDNYVNPSNFYDNVLTLKKACYESGNSKCSLCLKENPVYEIIQQLFKQWESRCVEIVLLNTVPGPGPQDGKLDGNFDIRTSTTDSGIWAKNRFEECANKVDYARTSDGGNNEMRDSVMESASTVLISSDRFDGTPNRPSSCSRTVGDARRRSGGAKHKQEVDVESVTGGRQLDEDVVPVAEHGIHATLASVDNSVKNDLDECGCWKSLSNDARSDLRKWRTFPPSLGDIMRSLNSSKLDLTGRVPLSELCVFEARTSCNEQQQFAAPCNFVEYANSDGVCERDNNVFGVIDQCVQVNDSEPVCGECGTDLVGQNNIKSLRVNNLEAIRQFSEYFKTSLETDSKLRQGIPDLNLDTDLGLGVELFTAEQTTPPHTDHHEDKEDVTSFIFSESDDSVDNCSDDMKNKKKSSSSANDNDSNVMESSDPPRPGILKSALKRSKKFYRKKHRVQFDESLNKFFEADYVILVRDEQDFDDEYRCECGNQFCYEGCYYEDEEDDDEIEYENSVDSPRFDFAAAFDPPMEFVDPVTLSPPDGYKDGCCQEASQKVSISTMTPNENHHHKKQGVDGESWENKQSNEIAAFNEKIKTQDCADDGFRKTDRRNQRYPFHGNDVNASSQLALFNEQNAQPANGQSRYIVETITMTTVTERRIVRESNDQLKINDVSMMNDRDKLNNGGILKGGKLWRNQETNTNANTSTEARRAEMEKDEDKRNVKFIRDDNDETDNCDRGENEKEFMLTFKLGNRVVPCNSLKPNSAVRQLFPDPRFVNPPSILDLEEDNLGKCEGKYLVTEESLRAFNEVNKRSVFAISGKERYPYKDGTFTVHSDDEDIPQNDLIKKTIERNTLRRSLMRYPRGERKREKKKKIEPSLEERIKQLTCVDDQDYEQVTTQDERRTDDPIPPRSSPPGEESHETTSRCEKSSSSLSSSSSVSSTYKKFTDLFARNKSDNQQNEHYPYYQPVYHAAQPDLGIDLKLQSGAGPLVSKQTSSVAKSGTNEARKQFLSSLAPLTACVTGHVEPNYGNRETLKLKLAGDRHSITSTASTGTEYSIGDIDDALAKPEDGGKAPQPDVVAGTPSGIDNQDELAMFVQQDAGRIERIKKRYSNTPSTVSDDDEHDDYGFSRRPSVRGIKPRFGSTTEILQQMQAQLQQPAPTKAGSHMTWPYYSAECVEKNGPPATSPRNPLPALKEEMNDMKSAEYTAKVVWEKSGTMPRASISSMQQQPLKIDTNSVQMFRLAPSDTITEVAVPYKCEPDPKTDLRRFPPGNIFQMKVSPVSSGQVRLPMTVADGQFAAHPIPVGTTSVIRVGHGQQQTFRVPCPVSGPVQVHLLATHHYENPQLRPSSQPIHFPQQIVVAKGTQTSTISTTSFYQLQTNTQSHYQNTANIPVTKASEHTTKLIQLNYNAAQHQSPPISSLTSSPTRVKTQNHLTERGIPEGAVSSSPAFIQDCVKPQPPLPISEPPNSTAQTQTKPGSMMYGMKV